MSMKWKINPNEWIKSMVPDLLKQTGDQLVRDIRGIVSTPYPGASSPGQPPHTRSGRLRSMVFSHVSRDEAYVGSAAKRGDAPYPKFLEEGTSKMAARPFLRPVVAFRKQNPIKLKRRRS
jgi:hypothetical protein